MSTTGKIIGYKKVKVWNKQKRCTQIYVLELEISAQAKRVFPAGTDGKARASSARVKRAWLKRGKELVPTKKRVFDHKGFHQARPLTYTIGKTVRPDSYDGSTDTCSRGINFFLSKEQAKNYI